MALHASSHKTTSTTLLRTSSWTGHTRLVPTRSAALRSTYAAYQMFTGFNKGAKIARAHNQTGPIRLSTTRRDDCAQYNYSATGHTWSSPIGLAAPKAAKPDHLQAVYPTTTAPRAALLGTPGRHS